MEFLPSVSGSATPLPVMEKIKSNLQELESHFCIQSGNKFLDTGIRHTVYGVAWGLLERDIPPLTNKYREAYQTAIQDVTAAWEKMEDELNDIELWQRETFDYGIKIAYYTEWIIDAKDIAF